MAPWVPASPCDPNSLIPLTEGGREFKAAKQSTDFLNVFNKVMTASVSVAASLFEALFEAFV